MIEQLIKELKQDPDFYFTYQCNIAVAFEQAFKESNLGKHLIENWSYWLNENGVDVINQIANEGAKRFLNSLIAE